MSADKNGRGLVLIGSKGTKKSELFYSLLQDKDLRLHANDILFIRVSGGQVLADSIERKLVMPTQIVEFYPRLASLFDNSKCENVILRKENCQDSDCLRVDDCRLDRGSPFCYEASKKAVALLDPYWIEGPTKHVKRTRLHWIFLLRYDTTSPPAVKMEVEDALRIMESGESPGLRTKIGPSKSQTFYNPHLLLTTPERIDYQKNFFRQLLENTRCYLINSGVATVDDIQNLIKQETEPESHE